MSGFKAEISRKAHVFARSYATYGNGRKAAREAGFEDEPHNLDKQIARMLARSDVRILIEQYTKEDSLGASATRTQRKAFWTKIMNDPTVHHRDRLKASELLGRSEGDFIERIEHSGGVSVEVYLPDNFRERAREDSVKEIEATVASVAEEEILS